MGYIPDNYDRFKQHDAEQERRLNRLPVCGKCGEPIQDEVYHCIDGLNLCNDCLHDYRVVNDF